MAAIGVLMCVAVPSSAFGQATRTWVSGVGDDVNPCSRTAPCKTWAGAISKTAAGGIIDALDPGGFGTVTATKSITFDGHGTLASTLGSGTNGINVNDSTTASPGTIKVVIRDLRIEGNGTTIGINGVNIVSGKSVRVEDTDISTFQNGIRFTTTSTPTRLVVDNSRITDNTNDGIIAAAGTGGTAGTANRLTVVNSKILNNDNNGIEGTALGTNKLTVNVFNSVVSDNGNIAAGALNNNGLLSNGGNSTFRIGLNQITGNNMGLQPQNGGAIQSFGNNLVGGNNVNGAPTAANVPGPEKRAFRRAMKRISR
jgi:hypothetical protein